VIVRLHDHYAELVTQVDHAVIAGSLAEAWSGTGDDCEELSPGLVTAARLHDIGWRHWEAAPHLNPDTTRPANFLDVMIDEHLRLYRLGIEEVESMNPYAGMLVSMHAAGIYTGRYGTQPALRLNRAPAVQTLVDEFVAEREAHYRGLRDTLGVTEERLWHDYVLLQVFDRVSLRVCLGDPAGLGRMEVALPAEETLTMERGSRGDERLTPWPFAPAELLIEVPTRVVSLGDCSDDAAFATIFAAAPIEARATTLRPSFS
jgi:hypothetical protein